MAGGGGRVRLQRSIERQAITVGAGAEHLLWGASQASTKGVTSRGVFVQTARGSLFLSAEAMRGPLTVNIGGDGSWLSTVECDTTVVVEPSALRLMPSGWMADLDQAHVWRTPGRGGTADPAEAQRPRIVRLSERIPQPPSPAWMGCLAEWIAQGSPLAARPEHPQADRVASLDRAIAGGDADACSSLMEGLLGWGQGLTPSGDDFLIGALLALSRAGHEWQAAESILDAAREVVTYAADNRTTSISASLLVCAAEGEADERLITLVDHVQTGVPGEAEAQAAASSWGATSGWDALAGIGVTLAAFVSQPDSQSRTS